MFKATLMILDVDDVSWWMEISDDGISWMADVDGGF